MKMYKVSLAMLTLAAAITLSACKKDHSGAPQNNCLITTVSPSPANADATFHLTYNKDGSIHSISTGYLVTTYTYNGNTAIGTSLSNGVFAHRSTITLNAAGFATNVKLETKQDGSAWTNNAIEYAGDQITKSTLTGSDGITGMTTYTWDQQNLVKIQDGNTITTLTYDTNKPSEIGDYLSLLQLTTGYPIYHSKNLIKSLKNGNDITDIDYTFDAEGKIVSVSVKTNGISSGLNYDYQCN